MSEPTPRDGAPSRRRPGTLPRPTRQRLATPPPVWWEDHRADLERRLQTLESRLQALEDWRATPWADR